MSALQFNANQFNAAQKASITVDQLVNTAGTTQTSDDNTLRLHMKHGKGANTGTVTYKANIHTKKSILSNLIDSKKAAHLNKQTGAVTLVKDAIKNQFHCSDEMANKILAKVGQQGHTITLGQLKAIKNEAHVVLGDSALKAFAGSDSQKQDLAITELVTALKPQAPTIKHARHMVKQLNLKDEPTLSGLLDKAKSGNLAEGQKALTELQKIKAGLEDPRVEGLFGDKESRDLLTAVKEVVGGAISEALGHVIPKELAANGQAKKKQWEDAGKKPETGQGLDAQKFRQEGLDDLLKGSSKNWVAASSGNTGAIMIKNDKGDNVAVLKIDVEAEVNACVQVSDAIASVKAGLAKKKVEVRFDGMVVSKLDASSRQNELNTRLGEMAQNVNNSRTTGTVTECRDKLQKGGAAMKCAFVPNTSTLDKLPTLDKVVLCKGELLPQQMGQAIVMAHMFGQSDHLGFSADPKAGDNLYTAGACNLANLLIKQDTGGLVFIDYGATDGGRLNGEPGFSANQMKDFFSAISRFATTDLTSGNIDQTLAGLAKNPKGGLKELMKAVFETSRESALFNKDEEGALASITDQDKARFAANVMLGVIQAMKVVAENPEVFAQGNPMFDDPQGVLKHVASLSQNLGAIEQNLKDYLKNNPPSL